MAEDEQHHASADQAGPRSGRQSFADAMQAGATKRADAASDLVDTRIAELERRLADVERRLAALESRD